MTSQVSVDEESAPGHIPPWRDRTLPPAERAEAVIPLMTVREKAAPEPGDVELRFGRSSGDIAASVPLRPVGAEREAGFGRRLLSWRPHRAPEESRG